MSGLAYHFDGRDIAEALSEVRQAVTSYSMMEVAQAYMLAVIQDHIAEIGTERHATANALGATPTSHYNADAVTEGEITNDSVSINVDIPGVGRAYKDLNISPKNGKYLTIPVNALAYGKRVKELEMAGYEIFRPKGKDVLGYVGADNLFIALYALSTGVTVPQDRTLMPTDEALTEAFVGGCTDFIEDLLSRRNI